ncbi:ABC transporter permease subunit [Paraburkholderia sp. CNPSo 3155]|uniref:ABC transporter permease n=1 Tax=Paraburkholderia atlantica TaxID=2654982 RepID=UPI00128E42C8|nr:ABC transporter permease [Paraburkholderia atlantica]MPW09019.1 ABC transporter permease subunit [Paraburkholderia atlantica]
MSLKKSAEALDCAIPANYAEAARSSHDVQRARQERRIPPVTVIIALAYVLVLLIAAFTPGLLGAGDATASSPEHALEVPSAEHWFGTDQLGRDVYSRVVVGTRWSLSIALSAMVIGVAGGTVLGLVAGLARGLLDEILSRVFDLLSSFPGVLLALFIAVLWGRGPLGTAVAIGVSSIPKFGRIIRGRTKQVANSDYVTHAVLFGHSQTRNVFRHVLPNVIGSVGLVAALDIGTAILAVSALSFLQMGPQPPTPEWGVMVAEGRNVLRIATWPSLFPGSAIVLAVVAFAILGHYVQARFEGRLR